jgi:hypothetical protein
MDVDEAKELVTGLRQRFDAPYSETDKSLITQLYKHVLGKTFKPTSCQSCYHDAVIEIYLHLKNYNTMATIHKYSMRAGFIINCPTFHNGTIYTNDNLTDDIAEEYIKQFPKNADLFDVNPNANPDNADSGKGRGGKGKKGGKSTKTDADANPDNADSGKDDGDGSDSEAVAGSETPDGSTIKDGAK